MALRVLRHDLVEATGSLRCRLAQRLTCVRWRPPARGRRVEVARKASTVCGRRRKAQVSCVRYQRCERPITIAPTSRGRAICLIGSTVGSRFAPHYSRRHSCRTPPASARSSDRRSTLACHRPPPRATPSRMDSCQHQHLRRDRWKRMEAAPGRQDAARCAYSAARCAYSQERAVIAGPAASAMMRSEVSRDPFRGGGSTRQRKGARRCSM
jgi:hypothetical protein